MLRIFIGSFLGKQDLFSGLCVVFPIEFKDNLTVSTVRNTGETGGIHNFNSNGFSANLALNKTSF